MNLRAELWTNRIKLATQKLWGIKFETLETNPQHKIFLLTFEHISAQANAPGMFCHDDLLEGAATHEPA